MEPPPLMPIFNGYGSQGESSSPGSNSAGSSPPRIPNMTPIEEYTTKQMPDQGAAEPKKRGRGRTRGAGPALLPCSVCGDMAPAHMHYGGVACFSCRAFFRRSVDKAYLYECQEGVSLIIIEQFSFPGRSIKGPIFGPRPSLAIVRTGISWT